jgi:biotin synthase
MSSETESSLNRVEVSEQVPADFLTTCKVIALTRLVCPKSNIPATTALAVIEGEAGRAGALDRGANVIMPNVTPEKYRALYEIYPEKGCLVETAEEVDRSIRDLVNRLGRTIGQGRGDSPAYLENET